MPQDDTPVSRAQKLRGLRQIEATLCREEHPKLRACGLSQDVAAALANEGLVELWLVADEGSDLDKYRVDTIAAAGLGMLAESDVSEPAPLRVAIELPHEPFWTKLRRALVSGVWDVVKIALGVPVGIVVGYFLWRFHWK